MSLFEDTFLTLAAPSEGIFRDKGSRFLAFAYPVQSEAEVKEHIQLLKKEHHKARHWCYAFRLGHDKQLFRANDDGEPSGTAGRPILGQIQSKDLSDVAVIVVRYFGGTLLGVGGLIQAYKQATADALERARVIEKIVREKYRIQFPYERMNEVMKIIKDQGLDQTHPDFGTNCSLEVAIRKRDADDIQTLFRKLEDVKITFTAGT
jgi:uncharacterized YigZ family protein